MASFWRRPLARGEIIGYLVFIAGFAVLQMRGGFRDTWEELAFLLMIIGVLVAGRSQRPVP